MEKPSGGSGEWRVASGEKNLGAVAPVSRVFAYEWQGKDLRDKECVRVASKGLTKRHFCASVQRTSSGRGMPPRVFWEKSAEVIENKGRESEKERKEKSRVRNRKEAKEIEEVKELEGQNPARFVRDNTRKSTLDTVCMSIVNLSSMV